MGKIKGYKQLGRSMHGLKDIKMGVKETRWGGGEVETGSIYLMIWANSRLL